MFGHMKSVICVAIAGMIAGCPMPPPGDGNPPLEDPIPEMIQQSDIAVRLVTVADGMTAPNWGTSPPGRPDRLAVTDQDGILWMVDPATGEKSVFLDVSDRLVSLGISGPGSFDERGLLGVAFHPDYATNGLLYTYTSEPVNGAADFSTIPMGEMANHQSVVTEWMVADPTSAGAVVDPESGRELLRIDQPQFNHDGGALVFGPAGMLFISLGDGGGADDQGVGHGENGNGQNPATILGSLVRIDPMGADGVNGQYGIPEDNPFVGMEGMLDEIYAYGMRNPFRFSFDRQTGELWLADVGQNDIEEVNVVTAGGNYGWRIKEGSFFFNPNGDADGFVTADPSGDVPASLMDPVAEYDHDEGISIIGGFVYRGSAISELAGLYVFGEFDGRLFHLDAENEILEFQLADRESLELSVLGFGEDGNGNLCLLGNETGVPFQETGVVLRLEPLEAE